jgi:putative nucleotidyltransferase with HDIG domain
MPVEFQEYLDPEFPVTERVSGRFRELRIAPVVQGRVETLLATLKLKHPETYLHCQRVGLLSSLAAEVVGLNPVALLLAGLLHDEGKARVSQDLLNKREEWTPADRKKIRGHVQDGYNTLRGVFDYSAMIALFHHRFQHEEYPLRLPTEVKELNFRSLTQVAYHAWLLSRVDCYDALHRVNTRNGSLQAYSGEEIRDRLLAPPLSEVPVERNLITRLYQAGVFTTYVVDPSGQPPQSELPPEVPVWWNDPEEIGKRLQLACLLGLFPSSSGPESAEGHSLSLLGTVVGLQGIAECFAALAKMVKDCRPIYCPRPYNGLHSLYRTYRNRPFPVPLAVRPELFELLMPLICAHFPRHETQYPGSTERLVAGTRAVLQEVSPDALRELIQFRRELSTTSVTLTTRKSAESFEKYYQRELAAEMAQGGNFTRSAYVQELLNGYPTVIGLYRCLERALYPTFPAKLLEVRQFGWCFSDVRVDPAFFSDCLVVALYLWLTVHSGERLQF